MPTFSLSCGATALTGLYIVFAGSNLYRLMNPLSGIDLTELHPNQIVHPLWEGSEKRQLKVYLSSSPKFSLDFLRADDWGKEEEDGTEKEPSAVLFWDEMLEGDVAKESLSKVLILEERCDEEEQVCVMESEGLNRTIASEWFDENSHSPFQNSFLVKGFQKLKSLFIQPSNEDSSSSSRKSLPETIYVPHKIWSSLMTNQTLHVHTLVLRNPKPTSTLRSRSQELQRLAQSDSILHDVTPMIKHDDPRPIKPSRILYHDIIYILRKLTNTLPSSSTPPPWNLSQTQPEPFFHYQLALRHKEQKISHPYWKPELSIRIVPLSTPHPIYLSQILPTVRLSSPHQQHPSGYAYTPPIFVDEMGLTSEKYIHINSTVQALPLKLSFDSNSLSPARWRLLQNFAQTLSNQKEFGFDDEDIDDLRRLIADTNVTLLGVTILASVLHLLFEFLTFKSDVEFWNSNTDITGLSIRALFLDVICQFIIMLYLIEKGSSLLVTVPCGIGVLIAIWKCKRGAGLTIQRNGEHGLKLLFGYRIVATRLSLTNNDPSKKTKKSSKELDMAALSIETDRIATLYLGSILFPLISLYALHALIHHPHSSWYSYLITTLSSAVYAVGFILMTPQLFLNYKLKSVAHLPWKVLCYKFLNTFIDDLFAFIVKMPTMARISCFRDDVVFLVYLGQRWVYEVDEERPVEGGGGVSKKEEEEKKKKKE